MDFKQIEAFINVAKYKSFSKAANISSFSQPAISSHIAKLEKDLGVQLLDRTSKEVTMTPAGESFLKYAIDIISTKERAVRNISSFNNKVEGKLNIAASTTPCNTLVPKLLRDFHLVYPGVNFSVTELNSGEIIEKVIKFDAEIGIVGEMVNDEKIDCYKLAEDELVVISPTSFNFPEEISLKFLLKNDFIMRERNSATRKTFEDFLHNKHIELNKLNVSCEVNSLDTIIQFVKSGIGVSVVSSQVCDDYVSCGLIRRSNIINTPMLRSIYLIVSSKRTLTSTAKAFFNLCRDKYKFEV
jgi:DNA-binding transcriptional LysR family regulator